MAALREAIGVRRQSPRKRAACSDWAKRYIRFCLSRQPTGADDECGRIPCGPLSDATVCRFRGSAQTLQISLHGAVRDTGDRIGNIGMELAQPLEKCFGIERRSSVSRIVAPGSAKQVCGESVHKGIVWICRVAFIDAGHALKIHFCPSRPIDSALHGTTLV